MPVLYEPHLRYDSTNAAYWNTQAMAPDTTILAIAPSELQGSQMTISFSRTVEAGFTEDRALIRLHMAVEAGPGAEMVPLSATQAAGIETNFGERWVSGLGGTVQNRWRVSEYIWRNFGADFPLDEQGNSKPGPIWRTTPVNLVGAGGTGALPDQLAATVTYRTASRKHWGRSYWGGLHTNWFSSEPQGKLASTFVDVVANEFATWFVQNQSEAAIVNMWVWSARHRGALSINEISVDDVPDIQRSRRAKFATYRKTIVS